MTPWSLAIILSTIFSFHLILHYMSQWQQLFYKWIPAHNIFNKNISSLIVLSFNSLKPIRGIDAFTAARHRAPWPRLLDVPHPDLQGTPFFFPFLDSMVTGDEKSMYLVPGILCGWHGETSVEAREGRLLPPSPDEGSGEDFVQVGVWGAGMRSPHPLGVRWETGWRDIFVF